MELFPILERMRHETPSKKRQVTYPGGPTTRTTCVFETLDLLRKVARRKLSPKTEEPIEGLIELSSAGKFNMGEEVLGLVSSAKVTLCTDSLRDDTESLLSSYVLVPASCELREARVLTSADEKCCEKLVDA